MRFQSRFLLFLFAVVTWGSARAEWMTDYLPALEKAQAEHKVLLIHFTRSDSSLACLKLQQEIFETDEFKALAREHLVLLEVDFPLKKYQTPGEKDRSQRMAEKFRIEEYPTVCLVGKDETDLGRLFYPSDVISLERHDLCVSGSAARWFPSYNRPARFLRGLNSALEQPLRTGEPAIATTNRIEIEQSIKTAELARRQKEPPAYAFPAPVLKYPAVTLRGISHGRNKTALINDQTLSAGEKGRIKAGDSSLEILVLEIREASALVRIEGEPSARELKMSKH